MKILIALGIASEIIGGYLIYFAITTEGIQPFMAFFGGWLVGWPIGGLLGLFIVSLLDNQP